MALAMMTILLTEAASAQTSWTQTVLPGAPLPSDLVVTSTTSGQSQYELIPGAGGSLARMRALQSGGKDVLPWGSSIMNSNFQWGLMAGTALDDGDPATDDRYYLRQAGGSGQRLAPVMQVEHDATTGRVDVFSVAKDQWSPHLRDAVASKVSHLTRYETLSDGSIKVRQVIRFGDATVNGSPLDVSTPYFEEILPFHVNNFNRLAERLNTNGSPQVVYTQGSNIPQNAQTDIASTSGYVVIYNNSNAFNSAVVGVVFGKTQMASPNQMILNYSDSTTEISVRPGIRLYDAAPGAILDLTYYLVPAYSLNSAFVSRINTLLAATPVPVVYPPSHTFTGELATIVQRLNDNLTETGVRSDRLGHDVTPAAVTARPMLLNGPEDDADIRARLAVFPQYPESLLSNYLYGTAAQKQSATNYFFRYPGSGDGNGLRDTYTDQMGRALMWDMYRYDIALGLGYATEAQKQTAENLAVEYINAKFPNLRTDQGGGGNLYLETYLAMGLAGLNFPDHPDSQLWVSRSVSYVAKFLDTYFPDGAGGESPRYHDWSLELVGKFLRVMQRRLDVDLYDHQSVRSALEWFIRFSSPPVSLTSNKMVTPAWGDSTYSSNGGSHYYYDLSIFAPYYQERDPDFSARLQDWWVRNGRPRQVYNAGAGGLTNILLLDPRLPTAVQRPITSTYSPRYGLATLRAGDGTADEFFASFKGGANGGVHSDADMGHFDLFAFGVPLALDSTSGPYVSGTTYNENTFAHNTVSFNGVSGGDTAGGQFLGFGTSEVADYVSAKTPYGTVSNRHMVMVKPDYLVVWDEITASSHADWYLHTPAQTLEWQDHKVISHTPWNVDLEVNFLLPAEPLVAPTYPGSVLNASDSGATLNPLASAASDPGTAGMFTTQGLSRCSANDVSRNPFPFSWQTYFSVRNSSASGDFLTVLQPRKVGQTPALTATLVSSNSSGVTVQVNFNGRVDTISITTSGATVTKGGQPAVQFAKTWPQSGVSGAAAYVKSDFYTNPVTTLSSALTTTGPVEVHTGTLALGASERIPNTSPLHLLPGGTFDLGSYTETTGTFIADGGRLIGTGTLRPSDIEWWGGLIEAPVAATGNFVKKGGADWSRPANLSYAGDTVIDVGTLAFPAGGPALPGTGRVVLTDGTGIRLDGASTGIGGLEVSGDTTITGTGTLAVNGAITGTGSLTNGGTLDLSGVASVADTLTFSTTGMVVLPAGGLTVKRLIVNGLIQTAGVPVSATTFPGLISGAGSITPLEDISTPGDPIATVSLGQIALAWAAADGATAYSVRRALVTGGPYTEVGRPVSNEFVDTGVTDGVTYFYIVVSLADLGESQPTNEVSATAIGPWYFDPNGATAGSVSNGGSYNWVSNSWTKTPGGTATTVASGPLRNVQFAATKPGLPLAYSVTLDSSYSGASHGFLSLRLTQGTVTFTGTPGNFYFTQPPLITADAGTTIRFAQTGSLAFNLNLKTVTFDGAGTTLISPDTVITNTGSIVKKGAGTMVIASPCTFNGITSIQGGVLRLATTDLPTLWLDATNARTQILESGAVGQWNDANGRGNFVSQSSSANRPLPVTDNTLAGAAKSLVDFGPFNASSGMWMQMGAAMTDIRSVFWVGKTTNDNFLLGSTATDYHFHSGGSGGPIWHATYTSANIRNGVTWLDGAPVTGTSTNMPSASDLVRLGVFASGNVSANTLGRDRTFRYGGEKIGEVIVFNTALTAQQQTDIDTYLAKKWFGTGVGIGNRLPTNTVVTLSNGGALDLSGINFQTLAGLSSNDASGTRVDLGAAELTIDGAGSSSFDGVVAGDGSLRKKGAGSFTLESACTYTGPTVVEGGTLMIVGSIASDVTVKNGAVLVNNGTIDGNVTVETGGSYQGEGTVTGTVAPGPPIVTITSPAADNTVMTDAAADLDLTATVAFNTAIATPAVAWSKVAGPGMVTFGDSTSAITTASFSTAGTYTLRCTASVMVNGQLLVGSADRIVRPGGPTADNFSTTFREGANGYTHASTFIRGDTASWNSGARDQLLIGRFNNQPMRGLFSFALTGIPADATVTSAAFDLWIASTSTGTVGNLELRPLLKDFVEGTGNGSVATNGAGTGADWNSRTGPTTANLWGVAGGQSGTDFSTTVIGSLNGFDTATTAVDTQCAFTLAPAFVTEANAAFAGARPLRFMMTMAGDTSGSNYYARFASDDYATLAQRPLLTIGYVVPNILLPQVDCGSAPAAASGQQVNLSGSGEGNLYWSQDSGPAAAAFDTPANPGTSVVFPESGTYVLRLTATNSAGSSSRTLAVDVATSDPFTSWQEAHWPGVNDPAIIGGDADPNSDGENNLLEFATGQDPKAATRVDITLASTPSGLDFTYTRNRDAVDAGWVFSVEHNDDLGASWTSVGPGDLVEDGPLQSLHAVIPAANDRRFVRLRVSVP